MKKWMYLLILCISTAMSAHADRDIVYAARYYTPPGSHKTSHFHLYRINPDGTGRTQLTFGKGDEDEPQWTADGQHIRFIEIDAQGNETSCEINAQGGRWRVLHAFYDDGPDFTKDGSNHILSLRTLIRTNAWGINTAWFGQHLSISKRRQATRRIN